MGEITSVTFHPWTYVQVQGRRSETALNHRRTGHTRLIHGYLMFRKTQTFCDDYLVPFTVRHFLMECPSLVELRERYLFLCRDEDGTFQMSLIHGERSLSPGYEVLMVV